VSSLLDAFLIFHKNIPNKSRTLFQQQQSQAGVGVGVERVQC